MSPFRRQLAIALSVAFAVAWIALCARIGWSLGRNAKNNRGGELAS